MPSPIRRHSEEPAKIQKLATNSLADFEKMKLKKNAPIVARAIEVFGSQHVATLWMSQPNPALRMKTPIQAIASIKGRGEVERILGRIENGVIS